MREQNGKKTTSKFNDNFVKTYDEDGYRIHTWSRR